MSEGEELTPTTIKESLGLSDEEAEEVERHLAFCKVINLLEKAQSLNRQKHKAKEVEQLIDGAINTLGELRGDES